jgi:hypothetical protein
VTFVRLNTLQRGGVPGFVLIGTAKEPTGALTGHAKVLELQMEPSPLVAAVEAGLRDAGRLGSSVGQQALHLAIRMTTSAFDTGSSVAALNKELTVTMQRALKDVIIGVGPLDELRVRRARKLTGK